MSYAPILFISAKTGQRLDKLFETIQYVDVQNGTRIPTGALNEMLARSTARVQPPSDKGKRLKIFYITQSSTRPPTFVAFVNQKALFHFSYQHCRPICWEACCLAFWFPNFFTTMMSACMAAATPA